MVTLKPLLNIFTYNNMKYTIRTTVLLTLFLLTIIPGTAQTGMVWFDPLECDTPYISGRAWNVETGKNYVRMPERFRQVMPKAVWGLSQQSAGLSIRFLSTAQEIQIKYTLQSDARYKNMAPLNHSGVDLYATDANGYTHWIGNHMGWNFGNKAGDTITFTFKHIKIPEFANRGLDFQLFLPPYNTVKSLKIGVPKGTPFQFLHQSAERPIVVYGSSIAQGASPSRPGLMWTNILQRETEYPIINLGFSGSALMEPPLFDAMSEIDARAYILDPMPNSYNLGEDIGKRIIAGVKKLRLKSTAPILLVESCGSPDNIYCPDINAEYRKGDAYLRKAYNQMLSEGIKGLFYLSNKEIGFTEDAMIEGTHPNDIGNMQYAKAYEKKLREMLPEDTPDKRYPPIRQRRDACYEWFPRHNEVIRLNHTTDPEILMIGNSITHFWGGHPYSNNFGGNTWNKFFGKRRVTNMGFGWDRIENVFWRIFHGELEGCQPKHICLLIGINNIGDKKEDIANGVVALARLIRQRQPQAKLHVIKIYPAKGHEEKVKRTNDLIEKLLPLDTRTDLVDLTSYLTLKDGSGKIDPTLFREGLHPNEKGYTRIAKGLKKVLAR